MNNQLANIPAINSGSLSSGSHSWALIMDACPMTRAGLCAVLKRSLFRTGEIVMLNRVSDIPSYITSNSPNIIVMDLCGENESVLQGLRSIASCQQRWPHSPIVICTTLTDIRFLYQVKLLKILSICHKHDTLQELEHCIDAAMAWSYRDSPAIQQLFDCRSSHFSVLTSREIDVLTLLFAGYSVSHTALKMQRDIRTISSHKRSAMAKLGYRNNYELFSRGKWMAKNGLFN